jgi:energy-coupling factor transport system permease protein
MLIYKKRNTMLQQLHPLAGVLTIIIYTMGALLINNPIYLLLLIIAVILLAFVDGSIDDVLLYIKMIIPIAIVIVLFNTIFNHNGNTAIIHLRNIPIIGSIRITLEALVYGIYQGIKLIGVTLIFGFGNLILHPDRTFSFFSKYMGNSALLMNMTLRLFPTILKSFYNILEVERLRGNRLHERSIGKSIKNYSNVLNILFQSSLEDAGDMAESMYSRGYGLGKRSVYFNEKPKIIDGIVIFMCIGSIVALILFQVSGYNTMEFYPTISNPLSYISVFGFFLCSLFYIPILINWGWKHGKN